MLSSVSQKSIAKHVSSLCAGFSIIELMVGLVMIAFLLSVGVPAFSHWVQNSQIRTSAQSIQNGLQLARAEAVRRNIPIRFQLVSTVENGCALSLTGINWVVSVDEVSGSCGAALLNDGFSISDTTNNPSPRIIQKYSGTEATPNTQLSADQATVAFNGLGRQVSVTMTGGTSTPSPPQQITMNVSSTTGGQCAADSGDKNDMRCLRIVVSPGGNIRMCDPALAAGDTQAC
jgi:type IV fimbrial biogenesis protein FimT